jgi:hypothetical protein
MSSYDTFAIAAYIRRALSSCAHRCLAQNTGESSWTRAEERAYEIQALGAVSTRRRQALVYLSLALSTGKAGRTHTIEADKGQLFQLNVVADARVAWT